MNVAVLALEGLFDTGLTTLLDSFTVANELAEHNGISVPRFKVSIVGVREKVRTAQGLFVPTAVVDNVFQADLVVVPAIGYRTPEPLVAALSRPDIVDATALLRDSAAGGARIAAACIGTFVLAESGLLDGRAATTTWWLTPLFRRRYPRIQIDSSRMVVQSEQFVTAGAALGHVDLALCLIRHVSPDLAALVARYLIADSRPSQTMYAISDHLLHADPIVAAFERFARNHIRECFSLDDAASSLATSKRTLTRRIRKVLGKAPITYVQDLRIEHAVHLLRTTDQTIDTIAEAVGYSDGGTLRSLLRRRLGQGIRAIKVSTA